jgi:hypothetical protein
MNDSKLENGCGLIIDPAVLADIRAQCQRRRAELEATGELGRRPIAPGASEGAFAALPASPPTPDTLSEAERFALAVQTMPSKVRRFFEYEEPVISSRQCESIEERSERQLRSSFGGWPGT